MTVNLPSNQCSTVVDYPSPQVSENCSTATVECVPASGSVFFMGTTTVTCTAVDENGNASQCSFQILVRDVTPPAITCPSDVTVNAPANACSTVVSYATPTASDSCAGPAGAGTDAVGLYDPSTATFYLKNANFSGSADTVFTFGAAMAGLVPVAGDWNGDGTDTIGLYNPASGNFFLRNSNTPGAADDSFVFGAGGAGYIPVAGDWDGDGDDTVGLYQPANGGFLLRNTNTGGPADLVFVFGPAGTDWTPIVGDWDGDGDDTIGVYSYAAYQFWYLRNENTPGAAEIAFG
jgi:hypothetical protein